jgi:crotonobetainyl-CoA:carnitine CoA-transferase CaiB-like acyl-CoA transferase
MFDALRGVTVLEVGAMTPGKYCGFLMVGWGAQSIRIERAAGDGGISNEDLQLNRGKQSMVLNLRDEADLETLLNLARTADVLIESYRPGVTARLGIDYDAIQALNPGIIYCSLSGFGQSGGQANRAAYDLMFMSETGLLHALQAGAGAPATPHTYLADATAGLTAAFAITSALHARGQTGRGRHIDLSIQESLFSLLSVSHGTQRQAAGVSVGVSVGVSGLESAQRAARPIFGIYQARDGRAIALTALREVSCRALFRYFGNEDLWRHGHDVGENGQAAKAFLEQRFAENDAQYWVETLGQLDIEIALVQSPEEAFDNEQLRGRNMIVDTLDPFGQPLRQIGFPATSRNGPALAPAPINKTND